MRDIAPDILERAAQGDLEAFEKVYRQTSGFVYNVSLGILRNTEDSQEATQDVFMKIYRNLKYFRFRSSFKTWVYRITVNTAINYYKRLRRQGKKIQEYAGLSRMEEEDSCKDNVKMPDIDQSYIETLLARLKPEYRSCLTLREIGGLNYKEIAEALRIPINTVRSRLSRGRQALVAIVKKDGELRCVARR